MIGASRFAKASEDPSRRSPSRAGKGLAVFAVLLLAVVPAVLIYVFAGAGPTVPNQDPVGKTFPSVQGQSLAGEPVRLPLDEPAILLAGYVQPAQFDADRWLIGLLQETPPVRILEVPTVRGLFPRVIAGKIDAGMRSGIPEEDWQVVVTVYGEDASRIVELTGNEGPRNIRVLLLDAEGRVRWFHDRGFSAGKLLELVQAARALE